MQINRSTRVNQFKDLFINASPDIVWQTLISINEWPEWQQEIISASIDKDAPEGGRFKIKIPGFEMKCIIRSLIDKKEFGWTGKNLFYDFEFLWKLKPYREGTHIIVEASIHGKLTKFFYKNLGYKLKKFLIGWTIQLKNECEVQYEQVS